MIHVTFEDGTLAQFAEGEVVTCCNWLSEDGEYFAGEYPCKADDISIGDYILAIGSRFRDLEGELYESANPLSNTKVARVYRVNTEG